MDSSNHKLDKILIESWNCLQTAVPRSPLEQKCLSMSFLLSLKGVVYMSQLTSSWRANTSTFKTKLIITLNYWSTSSIGQCWNVSWILRMMCFRILSKDSEYFFASESCRWNFNSLGFDVLAVFWFPPPTDLLLYLFLLYLKFRRPRLRELEPLLFSWTIFVTLVVSIFDFIVQCSSERT